MSKEPKRESVDDAHAMGRETVEFEAIETDPEHKRVEFELMLGSMQDGEYVEVCIDRDFQHPIEIDFGRTPETSTCFLVQGRECPQLKADYILIQPDVIAKDPRKGWVPIGGMHARRPKEEALETVYIGRDETPQLRLGPDVSRTHASVDFRRKPGIELLTLCADSHKKGFYARVVAHPEDIEKLPSDARRVR